MGVFSEAIESAQTAATGAAPAESSGSESGSPPSAAQSGTTPSESEQTAPSQQPTPSQGARTPAQPGTPAAASAPADPSKTVDLRALHEARTQTKGLKDLYGWLPRQEVGRFRQFYEAYAQNPQGTVLGEVEFDSPDVQQYLVQQLRQRGYALSQGGQQPQTSGYIQQQQQQHADPEPQPDYQLPDGTRFYSAQRQAEWRAWSQRQDDQRFDEKLKPIQQYVTEAQRSAVRATVAQNASQFAERLFAEAKTWRGFTEHKTAIAEKYAEYSQRLSAEAALYKAYLTVMHETVLPGLQKDERTAVAHELTQRTRATTPNPTRPTGQASDRRPESFGDAARRLLNGSRAS